MTGEMKSRKSTRERQRRKAGNSPAPGCAAEVPSLPASDAGGGPPAPKSSSSSMRVGSMLGALVGDAPHGGVVDGGGVLGVALLQLLLLPLPSYRTGKVDAFSI